MRVLVAARDVRVRRALTGLLALDGSVIGAVDAAEGPLLELDGRFRPDLVVLELDRGAESRDLRVVGELARRGRPVIAVCSGSTPCAAVLEAGALACLDEDGHFPDRLAEAVRRVGGPGTAAPPA